MRLLGLGIVAAALIVSLPAQADTMCAPVGGTCVGTNTELFGSSASDLPHETDDQSIFLDAATGVTSFNGQVGSQEGAPTANFVMNQPVDVANGFAGTTTPHGGTDATTLNFSIPGFQFGDFLFRTDLSNVTPLSMTVDVFSGSTLLDAFDINPADLKHDADLDWKLLSLGANDITSVALMSSGFEEVKQFEVSSVSEVPAPAALPLMFSGLTGLGWMLRKRRKPATVAA